MRSERMRRQATARFEALALDHAGIVRKVAYSYCRHPDDRADLEQEILTQLWRAYPGYDENRRFSTWMYRIALNVAITFVRRNNLRHRHMVPMPEDGAESLGATTEPAGEDDRIEWLEGFMATLKPLNRALLVLVLEERPHTEIAEVLGLSVSNVGTKVSRLKQQIRAARPEQDEPQERGGQ